jgi:phospholipid N-methyltransferase
MYDNVIAYLKERREFIKKSLDKYEGVTLISDDAFQLKTFLDLDKIELRSLDDIINGYEGRRARVNA